MKVDKRRRMAAARTSNPSSGHLEQPGPLGPQIEYLKEGDDTVLVEKEAEEELTTRPSQDVVNEYTTGFVLNIFDKNGGLTRSLITNFSTGVELTMVRVGASANAEMPDAPQNADKLLKPAVLSILKCEQVLRKEDSSLLRGEDMDQVRLALELSDGYDEILEILDPLVWGVTACKRRAQVLLAEFCGRVYKNGSAAIKRNRILVKGMEDLETFVTQPAQDALDTKFLKAQVAHQTETETLDRVKGMLQGQGTPGASGAAGGTTAGTGGATSGVQGAHAPGQNPVPPGAMPLMPDPKHPKPKRRSTGASASKKKKGKTT